VTDQHLSPAEAAKRLGVTQKALRLYEQRGLVAPLRSATGWRTYGPAEIARLHQVLALKGLGLPLATIAKLMRGPMASLAQVLALQEQALARESSRVGRALELVRAARGRLEKHYTPEEIAERRTQTFDQDQVTREWDVLIAEANALMAKGDPASPEALALARRWKAQVEKFSQGSPQLDAKARAVWNDAMSDPKAAPKLPMNPEMFAFMGKALAKLKEAG